MILPYNNIIMVKGIKSTLIYTAVYVKRYSAIRYIYPVKQDSKNGK